MDGIHYATREVVVMVTVNASDRRRGRRSGCGYGPRWSVRIAALAALVFLTCSAGRASAAGLLLADGGLGGALEVKEHAAKVTINNGIAVAEVTQVFLNTEDRQVEALYTFPVPRGASVANLSMWINGKEMTGEVLEKKRAREIYESYKQTRRDPGLLEQTDYRTFEMRVFPIGPRAEQRVQVTYYQELDFDHDWRRVTVAPGGANKIGVTSLHVPSVAGPPPIIGTPFSRANRERNCL
jgi:hypothetical protein